QPRPRHRRSRHHDGHARLRDPDLARASLSSGMDRLRSGLMAKRTPSFVCQNCGAVTTRWQGKCDSCGEWNTIVEENAASEIGAGPGRPARKGRPFPLEALAGDTQQAPRLASGIAELDRVTGGGFVRGSVLLVGGDPGIGKSTLLVQAAAALANAGHR